MSPVPAFDDVLRQALAGLNNDDVRIFYQYFEELRCYARACLSKKAKVMPGSSAVAQSALLSMFADLAVQQIPLSDVDDDGRPALWPLLLRYIERHCDKWNKCYLAKKRRAGEVSLHAAAEGAGGLDRGIDPADRRPAAAVLPS